MVPARVLWNHIPEVTKTEGYIDIPHLQDPPITCKT
jgi:hypothetical protein